MKFVFKSRRIEILDLLIEFIYLATIFIIPLYFSVSFPTYNVFELSKLVVFKVLVLLLLFLTIVKLVFYRPEGLFNLKKLGSFRRGFKKYALVPLIFIIGLGVSLFFSDNQTQSFFGSYDRQAGYLSFIFYFIWFILLIFNILTVDNRIFRRDIKDSLTNRIERIVFTITMSGFLVAVYGILQVLGIDFLSWPEDPLLTKRTLSTFGQPNFLASWLLLVIPLGVYLIYRSKKFLSKFFFSLILLAQLICLLFTSSRGGLVALGLTGFLFIIYLIFFTKLKNIYKFLAGSGLLILILVGFWGLNSFFPGRISSLLDFETGSLAARVNFYQAAADAISQKPLFGYGLENSGEVFIHYYQPEWGIYGDVSATTDKAHNLILDILLAVGFFGLTLYTILYYYFFRLARDNVKQNRIKYLSLALFLGTAAYLFSLLFSFSIISGEVYFWLFLALLVVISVGAGDEEKLIVKFESRKSIGAFTKILIVSGAVLVIGWGIYYEAKVLTADYYFSCLYYTLAEEKYFTTFVLADYATAQKANPINQEYYNRFLGDKLSDFYPNITELTVKEVSRKMLIEIDKKLLPQTYENFFVKAKINSVLGNYSVAEEYFNKVAGQSPYWPKTYIELGRLFTRQGNFKEALINYQTTEIILPNVNDKRLNDLHRNVLQLYRKIIFRELGDIYFKLKDYSKAEKYYQQAYRSDVKDFSLFKKIADTYYVRGDFEKAIEYNLRGATRNPRDYSWYFGVAALYKEIGNQVAAQAYFEQAIKLAPEEEKLIERQKDYQSK